MASEKAEKEIIDRCKKGDTIAFELLIKLYENKVYNIAYRMIGNYEDASDITQEIFIKIFKSIKTFRGDSSFSTWLYRLSINTCMDFQRKNKKTITYSIDKPLETDNGDIKRDIADEKQGPEERVYVKEIQSLVHKALGQLSEEHRTVIILKDLQGLSYKEICQILNCSIGTVKSRLSRARLSLKDILEKKEEHFIKDYRLNL